MDDGSGNTVPAYSLAGMEKHAAKHHIKLIKKGTEPTIPYIKTISVGKKDNSRRFKLLVSRAFNLHPSYSKVGFAAVFCDYIAKVQDRLFSETVELRNPNSNNVRWHGNELVFRLGGFLWHGLNESDDLTKKWYIAGAAAYTDPAGAMQFYFIPKDKVDIAGSPSFPYGGYRHIRIKVDSQLRNLLIKKEGKILFRVAVHVVNGWINGFSSNVGNVRLITCAQRVAWSDMPAQTREYTWNHEVGHRLGMVAYGDKVCFVHRNFAEKYKLPDAPSTLYGDNQALTTRTTRDPIVGNGATYDPQNKSWSGAPGCVMFGANSIGSRHAPMGYCAECTPVVRKLDLSG